MCPFSNTIPTTYLAYGLVGFSTKMMLIKGWIKVS